MSSSQVFPLSQQSKRHSKRLYRTLQICVNTNRLSTIFPQFDAAQPSRWSFSIRRFSNLPRNKKIQPKTVNHKAINWCYLLHTIHSKTSPTLWITDLNRRSPNRSAHVKPVFYPQPVHKLGITPGFSTVDKFRDPPWTGKINCLDNFIFFA